MAADKRALAEALRRCEARIRDLQSALDGERAERVRIARELLDDDGLTDNQVLDLAERVAKDLLAQ